MIKFDLTIPDFLDRTKGKTREEIDAVRSSLVERDSKRVRFLDRKPVVAGPKQET